MKLSSRLMLAMLMVGVLGSSSPANAIMFSISDIVFSALNGENEGLRWSVVPVAVASFDLSVGNSATFTFGTFSITNPINNPAVNDNDDSFNVSFNVAPPNPVAPAFRVGMPDATYVSGTNTNTGYVNFINTEMERTFGTGGQYFISFLDTAPTLRNVTQNLQATIRLVSDSAPTPPLPPGPAPVPEPGTLLLLGAGLVGLAVARKHFKK